MIDGEVIAIDVNALNWNESMLADTGKPMYGKSIFQDTDTGMGVYMIRYPAGTINPHHTHPCGHGMYVLQGTLVTHKGQYGPGCFVWFPEGGHMTHGASADGDVVALVVVNKPFAINYVAE
jgi:quercetin dioxygenase-like cupin family protein